VTRRDPKNVAASVRQRLLDRAHAQGQDFQLVLKHFAIERLLYRLQQSEHAGRFVLKGAMLFRVWEGPSARQTQDLDLHGSGEPDDMATIFRDLAGHAADPDDGLLFDPGSVRAEPIRDQAEYRGVRVRVQATLDTARIGTQVDVGFGDAITPAPTEAVYPSLLDLPAPTIRMYPRETVVAEKFQAIVLLSTANTRVKDYYDLWHLARQYEFDGATLGNAVHRTFERRGTVIPTEPPLGLSGAYLDNRDRGSQWTGLAGRAGASSAVSFREAGATIRDFVLPVTREGFEGVWRRGGPWTEIKRA
jgi:nucleotidyltransferase AbiEii toxin of type IV toxin-antitoxin system